MKNLANRYKPEGSTETTFEDVKAVTYTRHLENGQVSIMGYAGKSKKPNFYYRFASEHSAKEHINEWIASLKKRAALMAKIAEERKNFKHSLNVGDILYACWGYEQTNIDYYQVMEVKNKSVVVCKIITKREEDPRDFMSGLAFPVKNNFIGEQSLRRVTKYGVNIDEIRLARLWDGKGKIYSNYA